ncbi:MAG: right-handed parallel beta-helix repeat-containing protein [Chitinispirillaceae bacterium]|nr:right-handed parallel beta-helix repeat-containing protein [Chitinispirillaceae bacterium]
MKTNARTILLSALMLMVHFHPVAAETKVGGVLNGENRWDLPGSPYMVEADILIPRFAHLTIDPGVKVIIDSQPRPVPDTMAQFDALDSGSISIRVEGTLSCVGKRNRRIVFAPASTGENRLGWYGIIFNKVNGKFSEIAFTDITGAYYAVTVSACDPLIRNSILEHNNIGVNCLKNGAALVYNCMIANNFTAGIRVQQAAPHIANSIIMKNRNNGVWCDGVSPVRFEYNCVSGNRDGDFLDCDPRLGRPARITRTKDSTDIAWNRVGDPVFFGSASDSVAFSRDLQVPTDSSKVKNKRLARLVQKRPRDSSFARYRTKQRPRYFLSRYSPCINNGHPGNAFKDVDGSRNDIGIYGGPDFFVRDK